MRIHVLASGSSGNATVVDGSHGAVLIDCGLSKKTLLARFVQVGFDPGRLRAVFITHEHSDHVSGLGVCLRGLTKLGLDLKVFANEPTVAAAAVFEEKGVRGKREAVQTGDTINVAGMRILSFATSHNAASPQGFRIEADGQALGYLTDSGHVPAEASELLLDCNLLALESNHDREALRTGPYPPFLKALISSDQGHLANDQAAQTLGTLLNNRLQAVVGMHLSRNNNTPDLARAALVSTLAQHDHPAQVFIADQFKPLTIEL
ncbi:MAG: MBL fold metallo-hydrolase [Coriobacteriales bacterium]|jgi:phosphoribosyl 1,2-cyclic phosphodiesterase|nr:MBL fold metallo-hydrolase [Coriobacteriales bacterium]